MAIAHHHRASRLHTHRWAVSAGRVGTWLTVAAAMSAHPWTLARADAAALGRARVTAHVAAELRADAHHAFIARDADGDGRVRHAEVPYLRVTTFSRLDADGDGAVTAFEAMPAPADIQAAATRAEAVLRAAFDQLDANQDGWLEAAEAPAYVGPQATPVDPESFVRGLQTLNQVAPLPIAPGAEARPPVLMLPGFLMPASSFALMRQTLISAGYRDFKVLDRWPWFTDIDEYAAEGKWLGDRLRRRANAPQLAVLGHSMGGLVGRTMIHHLGYEPHVSHYVSFGTPHHGTVLGPLAHWYANTARQMTPGSKFLRALNVHEGKPSPVRYTSVHAQFDEIVNPHSSVNLAGAANPVVPFVFHTTMIMMPGVCEATLEALAR
jgi:pimeloyl-ACP methyl ester carboxylesterase